MSILSIQSHVTYGYVGNKAAVYPLQAMGYDVWPVNTVQFSNHTGYGKWKGQIFSAEHIVDVIDGIEELGVMDDCEAIISGYMGSLEICKVVSDAVMRFKKQNKALIYLCDPVMGSKNCYVKPEVLKFFCNELSADIITPNQFEAEMIAGITIRSVSDLEAVANHFHMRGVKILVITSVELDGGIYVLVSEQNGKYLVAIKNHEAQINGTGDLFSAVYLGSYLKHGNALLATQHAVYYTEQAINATIETSSRELQVLKVGYDLFENEKLPQCIGI